MSEEQQEPQPIPGWTFPQLGADDDYWSYVVARAWQREDGEWVAATLLDDDPDPDPLSVYLERQGNGGFQLVAAVPAELQVAQVQVVSFQEFSSIRRYAVPHLLYFKRRTRGFSQYEEREWVHRRTDTTPDAEDEQTEDDKGREPG